MVVASPTVHAASTTRLQHYQWIKFRHRTRCSHQHLMAEAPILIKMVKQIGGGSSNTSRDAVDRLVIRKKENRPEAATQVLFFILNREDFSFVIHLVNSRGK